MSSACVSITIHFIDGRARTFYKETDAFIEWAIETRDDLRVLVIYRLKERHEIPIENILYWTIGVRNVISDTVHADNVININKIFSGNRYCITCNIYFTRLFTGARLDESRVHVGHTVLYACCGLFEALSHDDAHCIKYSASWNDVVKKLVEASK